MDGRFNGTMQNVVWPTLVAVATKFGLGTEIQTPTGLFCSLSLHAHLQDTVTCSIIASIWLKNPSNFLVSGYQSLAELYVVKVLCVSRRWDDVRPFLDSCPGLSESVRDSIARQVAAYRHKLEEAEANRIEVLESHSNYSENTDNQTFDSAFGQMDTANGNCFAFI